MAENSTVIVELCSRCNKNPRAHGHDWCKSCKAEAERNYRDSAEKRAYLRGKEEMRRALAAAFLQIGGAGGFSQVEISNMIMQAPGPQWSDAQSN